MGASEGIDLALRALVDPGDEVLVVEPAYVSYIPCVDYAEEFRCQFRCRRRTGSV